jgi:hypothetical protein
MPSPDAGDHLARSTRIATLAFSPIAADARVLRQSAFLSDLGSVQVFGYGEAGPLPGGATLSSIAPPARDRMWMRLQRAGLLLLGRLGWKTAYDRLYWSYDLYQRASTALEASDADLFVANDWTALPAVARAATRRKRAFLLDLHEFGPRQWDHRRMFLLLRAPMVRALLQRYAKQAAATFTVNGSIADLYEEAFGFQPSVLRNIPARDEERDRAPDGPKTGATVEGDRGQTRMIHHGAAIPARELERMIDVMALLPDSFQLDFMLIPTSPEYLRSLEARAAKTAPERIRFRAPVAPAQIVSSIAEYDIGLFLLPPTTTNYALALPNKLFDFIAAGLAVVIGPSPEMARLLEQEDCGKITTGFSEAELAECLMSLDRDEIERLKANSLRASSRLSARSEHEAMLAAARHALDIPRDAQG